MNSKPTIVTPAEGFHNANLDDARGRLLKGGTYRDLSTVCIIPTRGMIHARTLQSWFGLLTPMNQKFTRLFMTGMEVGDAYNQAIALILGNEELSKWKYVLTMEDDNMPPPDGLMKLFESIEGNVDGNKYDVVGGLYWTKGELGQPMIYGDPNVHPKNFMPQIPRPDTIQPCNGMGMGFHLWRMDLFRNSNIPRPWFKTCQDYEHGRGVKMYTQDLYFFENAGKAGHRFACDTRVRVGHYDAQTDIVW